MRDFMTEQLVAKKTTAKDIMIKVALILATVISLTCSIANSLFTILFMVLIFVDMFVFKRLDVEYEYTYFEGTLDVAKIMSKQLRKELFSTDVKEEMELLAPTGIPEVERCVAEKILDYSTKNPENRTYTMITSYKGQKVKMIFEPNEKMLKSIRDAVPRKVVF